jgi:hypothetical protein
MLAVFPNCFTKALAEKGRVHISSPLSEQVRVRFRTKERGRRMSKRRHTEAEMIGALKQLEAGRKSEDVAREVG